jgi:hypothetical protein
LCFDSSRIAEVSFFFFLGVRVFFTDLKIGNLLISYVCILCFFRRELKPRKEIVAVVLAILVYYGKNYDWFPLITAVLGGYLFKKQ